MPESKDVDPVTVFNFGLDIQGITDGEVYFTECSQPESEVQVIDHQQRDKSGKVQHYSVPGNMKWNQVTLKRPFTKDTTFWEAHEKILHGQADLARGHGSITGYDAKGTPVIQFTFTNGWVSKWQGPNFSAKGNDIAIETITVASDGFKRVKV